MSRVHDALRKAAQENPEVSRPDADNLRGGSFARSPRLDGAFDKGFRQAEEPAEIGDIEVYIQNARRVEYSPLTDALLVNPSKPREAPAEEFRTLRTRLNHLQTLQPLHTLVVTSASPAEGKSFTAANLALTQAQLADKRVLLADFDFRRPTVDKTFQIPISPGMTNYLTGTASLGDILMREGDNNL